MKIKWTLEKILKEAKIIYGDKYDYSKVIFEKEPISLKKNVEIICPKHGSFFKTIGRHIRNKQGCQYCGRERSISGSHRAFIASDFITKAIAMHGDTYDYTNVVDKEIGGSTLKIPIVCKKHGIFLQKASKHLTGQGCGKCGGTAKLTLEQVLSKANHVHNNRYDYSNLKEYSHLRTYANIICPVHGEFSQLIINHLSGAGCAKCSLSKGEILISNILKELEISDVVLEKTFEGLINPETGKKLRFDFYLPECNLLIEYDGQHHFYPAYFNKKQTKNNAIKDLEKVKERDNIKTEFAKNNNIKLVRITYSQTETAFNLIKDAL